MNEEIIKILVANDYTDQEAKETLKSYEYLVNENRGASVNASIIMDQHAEDLDAGKIWEIRSK